MPCVPAPCRIAALLVLATLHAPASAQDDGAYHMRDWTLSDGVEAERRALHARYLDCSAHAAEGFLGGLEAMTCAETFMRLKLTFLPGATYESFITRSPQSRALANAKGYAAYRAWLIRETVLASAE